MESEKQNKSEYAGENEYYEDIGEIEVTGRYLKCLKKVYKNNGFLKATKYELDSTKHSLSRRVKGLVAFCKSWADPWIEPDAEKAERNFYILRAEYLKGDKTKWKNKKTNKE